MERILGIDLGTTNSVVSYLEQGVPVVIQNAEGSRTTPSVVLYKSPDEVLVGELAKRQASTSPHLCIHSVKRFMGARFSESAPLMEGISYRVVPGPDDSILIDVGWAKFTPEEVSAQILSKMKSTAEDFFGESISKVVITVPAYFNDAQRSATKRAGELADLDVVRIINEPTAAALAFGIDRKTQQSLAIFDLGGGTFDISILDVNKDIFEVRSTRGDTFLGGDNFDHKIVQSIVEKFHEEHGIDISSDAQAMQRVREAAEQAKCELSSTQETSINLPFISMGPEGPLHIQQQLTRPMLDAILSTFTPRIVECCEMVISDSKLQTKEISTVLLVGGSTRIPYWQACVKALFDKDPAKTVNPDEAVSVGAAIQGAIMSGGLREVLLLDITPLSLGIELVGGVFGVLIPRNSSIPTSTTKTFTTVKDNQTTVKVHVLQGERKVAVENQSLGIVKLTGILPAPKEIPAIEVNFQIDANGILQVSATDVTTGASNSITIESYASTSPELAVETIKKAEEAADEDKVYIRIQYLKNQVNQMLETVLGAADDEVYPLSDVLVKQFKEAAFKTDVALSTEDIEEAEQCFKVLREIFTEAEGHIAMANHRKNSSGSAESLEDLLS